MTVSSVKTVLKILVALALATALAYWAFKPVPVAVDLAVVKRAAMEVTIDGVGLTRVHDIYTVSTPVSGRLRRLEVHVGDVVVAGETLLATIEPAQPQFLDARALAQAEARVKASEAAKSLARAEYNRVKAELAFALANQRRTSELFKKQAVSEREFDQAELAAKTRAAAVDSALATLKVRDFEHETAIAALIAPASVAEGQLTCCVEVRAPVNGRVLQLLRRSEGVVGRSSPLMKIGDPDRLEVVVDLLSSDAVRVREGASVVLNGWGGDNSAKGRVRKVEPYGFTKTSALGIEEQRVNVIIDFTEPADKRPVLGHGFRVEARISEWRSDSALQIPIGSVFRHQGQWAVFVDDAGLAKLTVVEIGRANGRTMHLIKGLKEGVHVIRHPSDRVTNGVEIVRRLVQ